MNPVLLLWRTWGKLVSGPCGADSLTTLDGAEAEAARYTNASTWRVTLNAARTAEQNNLSEEFIWWSDYYEKSQNQIFIVLIRSI
jgi:hypothetical protein